MPATSSERPMVSGTNRKWYTVVIANCHRARSRFIVPPRDRPVPPASPEASITAAGGGRSRPGPTGRTSDPTFPGRTARPLPDDRRIEDLLAAVLAGGAVHVIVDLTG